MQLMALNALLLFDAIFIFFLFLVSVSCLLYYLPLVPPSRSSPREVNPEEDADLESALVESSQSESTHYCHHHYVRERGRDLDVDLDVEDRDDERGVDCELQHHHPCGGALYHQVADHDDQMEENDPSPTANPSPMHRHFGPHTPTHSHSNLNQNQPQQPQSAHDHPATHIIMTPPQRKYYQNGGRDAPVETV